jgi:hypothetical protein
MTDAVIKVFGVFEEAEKAREQLLAAGFDREQVQLNSNDDEAGAVQGNFISGDTDSERDRSGGYFDPMAGPDDHVYERDFKDVVQRGHYILMVEPDGEEQAAHARRIVEQAEDSGEGERINGAPH